MHYPRGSKYFGYQQWQCSGIKAAHRRELAHATSVELHKRLYDLLHSNKVPAFTHAEIVLQGQGHDNGV